MTDTLTFVHLTDLHVGDPAVPDDHLFSETSRTLQTILAEVKRLIPAPKFIVASGDLTNRGDVASYHQLKRLFAEAELDMPVLWALGNHDTRAGFYQGMLGRTDNPDAPYFHDDIVAGIHVVTLDSSTPKRVGGTIEPEQFDWLRRTLDSHPELPKLLVVHHAPALDEVPDMEWESISIADTAKLRDLLAGRGNILGIMCGHIHFDRVSNWFGIPVVVGIGQHAATDVLYLHEGLRMVSGASFALGTVRPSGLTVSFVPQPSERRELHSFTFAAMTVRLKEHEAKLAAAE